VASERLKPVEHVVSILGFGKKQAVVQSPETKDEDEVEFSISRGVKEAA